MSTRHLFLPFLVALAGFVSCDEFKPEVAVGCVTVDNEYFCALTSAIGGESEGNQKWAFYDEGKVRLRCPAEPLQTVRRRKLSRDRPFDYPVP